ncbi:DUF2382 domain-containing protein [Kytococcus sp. Marseille-QA3725]
MFSKDQLRALRNGTMYGADGEKIGKVEEIYLDDRTNEPEWATVNTGLFGTSQSFVPLAGASTSDDGLTVKYTKEQVKDAPRVEGGQHLDAEQERELYRYYDMGADDRDMDRDRDRDRDAAVGTAGAAGTAGVAADRDRDMDRDRDRVDDRDMDRDRDRVDVDDDSMVRHEERLKVGTQREEGGNLRLRKYVDTEEQTVSVPVETETAKVVSRPVDGRATDGRDAFREEEVSVDLKNERPVVSKETVAVEEVGIETERHTENVQVSDSVRKERVEVEGDDVDVDRDGRI